MAIFDNNDKSKPKQTHWYILNQEEGYLKKIIDSGDAQSKKSSEPDRKAMTKCRRNITKGNNGYSKKH